MQSQPLLARCAATADYKCSVKMPANEFQRIIRDMGVMGDTCACGGAEEGA